MVSSQVHDQLACPRSAFWFMAACKSGISFQVYGLTVRYVAARFAELQDVVHLGMQSSGPSVPQDTKLPG